MVKKVSVFLSEDVYDTLLRRVGRGNLSTYISHLIMCDTDTLTQYQTDSTTTTVRTVSCDTSSQECKGPVVAVDEREQEIKALYYKAQYGRKSEQMFKKRVEQILFQKYGYSFEDIKALSKKYWKKIQENYA
jgi:hypothetical protein